MDKNRHSKRAPGSGLIAMATTAVICAAWSSSALSAATTEAECDSVARDIRTLEVPLNELSAHRVDHVTIDAGPSNLDLLDAREANSESVAPFLFLTPRVASVLREIFDATRGSGIQPDTNETSSSPIAESDVIDISTILDESDRANLAEGEISLPLFQQRMFRTDI